MSKIEQKKLKGIVSISSDDFFSKILIKKQAKNNHLIIIIKRTKLFLQKQLKKPKKNYQNLHPHLQLLQNQFNYQIIFLNKFQTANLN
jgi:hypothetical protein